MSAAEQLERVLYILAVASRAEGATYDELARALGCSKETIVRDLEEAISSIYNHPAGAVEPFEIMIGADGVYVIAANEFKRPVRLNEREALALGLGLRVLAADAESERRAQILALANRLETELASPEIVLQPLSVVREGAAYIPALEVVFEEDDLRGLFMDAIEAEKICVLEYLKPFKEPARRRVAPVRLIYGKGHWYLGGRDVDVGEDRIFRLDRILNASVTNDPFERDQVADPTAFYSAEEQHEVEARVRYSGSIAKWIAERGGERLEEDGSVVVAHRVADTDWLVRHVLHYGGEAVVETPELRKVVAARAAELCA